MGECWSAKTESRHTALRMMRTIKETIKVLISYNLYAIIFDVPSSIRAIRISKS